MDLSIVIVNWNSSDYLKACLASVFCNQPRVSHEIIVIDSGSHDGCDRMLEARYPTVRFIASEINLGFGKANNLAFEQSSGQVVLFLNPDTEVIGNAIEVMYEQLHRLPKAGAVGCRLLNGDGSLQTSCVQGFPTVINQVLDADWLRLRWPASRLWGTAALYSDDRLPQPVEAITGACLMMRRELFQRVGQFGREYFMYAEDIDLCHKVRSVGLKVYYLPQATVVHYGGGSSQGAASDFSAVMMRESIFRFLTRTRGRSYAALYRVAMFHGALLRLAIVRLLLLNEGHQAQRPGLPHALRKWRAVLNWSVSRRSVVKRYESIT